MEASSALQKDPLQALFNYLLEVVLNRLCLCCFRGLEKQLGRNQTGEGKEPDWGQGLGSDSSIWGLGTRGLCPEKAGLLLLKLVWGPLSTPPLASILGF